MNSTTKLILAGLVVIAAILLVQKFVPAGPLGGPSTAAGIELVNPSGFVNSEPFKIADLVGKKVILVDFWTYSCINCQRTLPYVNMWQEKYGPKGLAIIGVHTPEFAFEKDIANVRTAVKKFGIKYPVVLDNDYGTWRAYGNQYWPHKYLIDKTGAIVYDHIGEGNYDETEREIQKLLGDSEAIQTPKATIPVDFDKVGTPEIYFGADRNAERLGNKVAGDAVGGKVGRQKLTFSDEWYEGILYMAGEWDFTAEYARCIRDCRVRLGYEARQVNLVAGAAAGGKVRVFRDGIEQPAATISGAMLYTIINDSAYGNHALELQVDPGVDLFTFTFS